MPLREIAELLRHKMEQRLDKKVERWGEASSCSATDLLLLLNWPGRCGRVCSRSEPQEHQPSPEVVQPRAHWPAVTRARAWRDPATDSVAPCATRAVILSRITSNVTKTTHAGVARAL